jgi:O-Antigen ligase
MTRDGGAGVAAPLHKDVLFKLLWLVVAAGSALVGVAFARNRLDSFRLPKIALYEAEAIVCLALLLMLLLWRRREVVNELRPHRLPLSIAAAAVIWTAVSSLLSTNRTLSMPSMIWVASCAIVFVATLLVACRGKGAILACLPLLAAAVNAVFALTQRTGWFSPTAFEEKTPEQFRISALIGNPNDLGVYLFLCGLSAVGLAAAYRGRQQWLNALSVLLIVALLATQTVSALIAFAAAALVMTVLLTRRVKFAAVLVACAMLLIVVIPPLRHRAMYIGTLVRQGSFTRATSFRVPAYLVAWQLFLDHPVAGAGPGTYGWWYLPYKMQLNATHPTFREGIENFGEAHNDHLQTLAVSGSPGYLIFLAAIGSLAVLSFREADRELRPRFAKALALPLAAGFAVVTLAQFPLELASTASVAIHYAALCCAWAAKE